MIKITLKDGNVMEVEKGTSIIDVAKKISEGLARVATCGTVDSEVKDLRYELNEDCKLTIETFESSLDGKKAYWHTSSHIMAQAVKRLFPEVKLAIGPAIDNGFYYDFDVKNAFSDEDKEKIEEEMKKIIKEDIPIERTTLSRQEAINMMKKNEEKYKVELIEDLPEGEEISFYKQGDFIDLCAGPHLLSTGKVKAIKILSSSSAYWRGDEKREVLQRIYAISFPKASMLEEHLKLLEEAKERDHRKIGKELDLFCFSDYVGGGLPLYTPKGTIVKDTLQREIEKICRNYGFEKVSCPSLANISLFETSGHAQKFNDELFRVNSPKGHEFVLKPVQCPHHTQIYASKMRSYKDLPIRYMESDKQYRAELQGSVGGLSRVYAITVEDGHCFCRVDQVKDEVINLCNIIRDFFTRMGLWDNHWVSLSVRDYDHPEKYIGSKEDWDLCEKMLQEVSDELGLEAKRCEGEAALYGPKLDFMFNDALGREVQIPTVQVDFATPKRFGLYYVDKNGEKQTPVMVHRAILGSYERFIALILEQFKGALPTWLSPVQVRILPISDNHLEYANKIKEAIADEDIRVELDDRQEKTGYKIREAQVQKIPYMLVVGDKEIEGNTVSVRSREDGDMGSYKLEDFIKMIKEDIKSQKVNKK